MLLVGDKIKQTKAIKGFNYVGKKFTVDAVEGNSISFSSYMGRGVMTLTEFEEYFEKVSEPTWSEWFYNPRSNLYYRTKGDLMEAREFYNSKYSVFSKPYKDDTFNLEIGIEVCKLKLKMKKLNLELDEMEKELSKY